MISFTDQSLMSRTEKGDIKAKTEALKKVIFMLLSGEKLPGLLMTIIRFCLPVQVRNPYYRFRCTKFYYG